MFAWDVVDLKHCDCTVETTQNHGTHYPYQVFWRPNLKGFHRFYALWETLRSTYAETRRCFVGTDQTKTPDGTVNNLHAYRVLF
jgi:hypothetical protein